MSVSRNVRELYRNIEQPASFAQIIELTQQVPVNPDAIYYAGVCYYYGYGVQQDYVKAVDYLIKAADYAHPGACYMAGLCLEKGRGVDVNLKKASYFYAKAAKNNNDFIDVNGYSPGVEAIKRLQRLRDNCDVVDEGVIACNLAYCYENGYCLPTDHREAKKLYQRAIEIDNPYAMIRLAAFYLDGRPGVPVNVIRALNLYRDAIMKNPNISVKVSRILEGAIEKFPEYRNKIENILIDCYEHSRALPKYHRFLTASIEFHHKILRQADRSGFDRVNEIYRITRLYKLLLECEVAVLHDRQDEQRVEGDREDSLVTGRLILLIERLRTNATELGHTAHDAAKIESIESKYGVDAASILNFLRFYREAERYARSIQKELIFLKRRILHPVTPWQVRNVFKQWVDGMPRGMQEILALLKSIEKDNANDVLKAYQHVLEKLAMRVDHDLFDRHVAVKNFYEEAYEGLQLYQFNAEPVAKQVVKTVVETKENQQTVIVPEESSAPVALVSAPQFYFIPAAEMPLPSAPELTTPPQYFVTAEQLPSVLATVQPPSLYLSTNQFNFWMDQCSVVPTQGVEQAAPLEPVYVATNRKSAVLS